MFRPNYTNRTIFFLPKTSYKSTEPYTCDIQIDTDRRSTDISWNCLIRKQLFTALRKYSINCLHLFCLDHFLLKLFFSEYGTAHYIRWCFYPSEIQSFIKTYVRTHTIISSYMHTVQNCHGCSHICIIDWIIFSFFQLTEIQFSRTF